MDQQRLVDLITELVVRELASSIDVATSLAPPARGVLVVCGDGDRDMAELPAQLREVPQVTVVPSATWPQARLAKLLGAPRVGLNLLALAPASWQAAVRECTTLLLPNPTWQDFVEMALLSGRTPHVAAGLQALIENRPVLAVAADVNFLLRHAAHLQKPFLAVLGGHVAAVQSFGVRCVEMAAVGSELRPGTARPNNGRGRDVLTREDVESMLATGATRIEVVHGTIVTALAREAADKAGVPIQQS